MIPAKEIKYNDTSDIFLGLEISEPEEVEEDEE